jgi:hypothetical protein
MGLITDRKTAFKRQAQGKGFVIPILGLAQGVTTAAAAASGFFSCSLNFNALGTTLPSTYQGLILPPNTSDRLRIMMGQAGMSALRTLYLARVYKMGTLDLTATGDQFTADGAVTYPVTRTEFGVSGEPITLLPVLQITTATTTTPAVIRLRTAAGAAGYVDQDGNSTVGTKDFTLPNAATAVQSTFLLRMEDGDSGVRSISAIEVTTAAATGAANIWGLELIMPLSSALLGTAALNDAIFGGLAMSNLNPAVPTAGTLESYLCFWGSGVATTTIPQMFLTGVVDA